MPPPKKSQKKKKKSMSDSIGLGVRLSSNTLSRNTDVAGHWNAL